MGPIQKRNRKQTRKIGRNLYSIIFDLYDSNKRTYNKTVKIKNTIFE